MQSLKTVSQELDRLAFLRIERAKDVNLAGPAVELDVVRMNLPIECDAEGTSKPTPQSCRVS